jgi:hypothetical protein
MRFTAEIAEHAENTLRVRRRIGINQSISPCLVDRRDDGDPAAGEEENLTTERTDNTEEMRGA